MENIKAIIFDWARTLFNPNNQTEVPGTYEILNYCSSKGYRLATGSLVTQMFTPSLTPDMRADEIKKSRLAKYFEIIDTIKDTNKETLLDRIVNELRLPPEQILIVDDRTIRGIAYANKHGHPSIWLQKGKFSEEMPNADTGQPTYTIHSLEELYNII